MTFFFWGLQNPYTSLPRVYATDGFRWTRSYPTSYLHSEITPRGIKCLQIDDDHTQQCHFQEHERIANESVSRTLKKKKVWMINANRHYDDRSSCFLGVNFSRAWLIMLRNFRTNADVCVKRGKLWFIRFVKTTRDHGIF